MIRTTVFIISILLLGACLALRDNPGRPVSGELRELTEGEVSVSYFVSGTGQPVVLLPSFARSASDFNELAEQLNQQGFRTLALEPRGINGSSLPLLDISLHDYAADIASVLTAEKIAEPVFLIGHAFGNRVARTFATDYPQQVRALVLLGAGGEVQPESPVSTAIFKALVGLWPDSQHRAAVEYAFFADGHRAPDYWLRGWYPLAGLAQARATATTPYAEWGQGGSAPVRIFQALQDRAAPPSVPSDRLDSLYPERVSLVSIEDAGHAMLPEQFERVSREILDFLQSF